MESVLSEVRAAFLRNLGEDGKRLLLEKTKVAIDNLMTKEQDEFRIALQVWLRAQADDGDKFTRTAARLVERLRFRTRGFTDVEISELAGIGITREQPLPSLIGFSIMRVEPRYREICYADILSDVLGSYTIDFIKRNVSVGGERQEDGRIEWAGSVGQTIRDLKRCVPDSFVDARGAVASADLIGGNRSILMKAVAAPSRTLPDEEEDAPREVTAVVFCFSPFAEFFCDDDDPIAMAFFDAVEGRGGAVRNYLKLQQSLAREEGISKVMRDGQQANETNELLLLRTLVGRDTRDTELGAVAGLHVVQDAEGNREATATAFCDDYLQRNQEFAEWFLREANAHVACTFQIGNVALRLAEVVVMSSDRPTVKQPVPLSTQLAMRLQSLWEEHSRLLQIGGTCVAALDDTRLSFECGRAKLASDLAVALLDASVSRLTEALGAAESFTPMRQLRLILAVTKAEFGLVTDPAGEAETMEREIIRASSHLDGGTGNVVALVPRILQPRDKPSPFWKTRSWSVITRHATSTLEKFVRLARFADAQPTGRDVPPLPACLRDLQRAELSCGRDESGANRSFIILGLPTYALGTYEKAVNESPVANLVQYLYGGVLQQMRKEQQVIRQYAYRASSDMERSLDTALYLLHDGDRLYMPSRANRILSLGMPLTAGDREHLLSFAHTMRSVCGQLRQVQREATLLSWILEPTKAVDGRAGLRRRRKEVAVGMFVAKAMLSGLSNGLRRLSDSDLSAVAGTSRAIPQLRQKLILELAFAEEGAWDWEETIQNLPDAVKSIAHLNVQIDGLSTRSSPADRAFVAGAALAEMLQKAFVAAVRSAVDCEAFLDCSHSDEINGSLDTIVVTNSASDADVATLHGAAQNNGGNALDGVARANRLCKLLGGDADEVISDVGERQVKTTLRLRL
jgi:hypothetical protein